MPSPGARWEPQGPPARQPHAYERTGTAKLVTRFRPASGQRPAASGQVPATGGTHAPTAVLHPWLKTELEQRLASLPGGTTHEAARPPLARWATWRGRSRYGPPPLPPLRLILVWDTLAGHRTPDVVLGLVAHGVRPLYTPLSGSGLNLAESVQRMLVRRALAGPHPQTPAQIIAWLEEGDRGGVE